MENIPAPELLKLEEEFKNQRVTLEGNRSGDYSLNDPVSVDVYLHVINANGTAEGGNVL